VIVEQAKRQGNRRLAVGNLEVGRWWRWLGKAAGIDIDVELHLDHLDVLIVLGVTSATDLRLERQLQAVHVAVIGIVGGHGVGIGFLHGPIDVMSRPIHPQVEWTSTLWMDPQDIVDPTIDAALASALNLGGAAAWEPIGIAAPVSLVDRSEALGLALFLAYLPGGILTPDDGAVETAGPAGGTEHVLLGVATGGHVLPRLQGALESSGLQLSPRIHGVNPVPR
jgi:hypothetical protein